MTRGFSVYLDLLRFAAALVVVLSHFAYPRFTRGDYLILREWNVGSDAVVVFFVLSGLVIAYAAERDGDAGRFAFRRITRLMSVVAPALVLTVCLDRIGAAHDPQGYHGWWYNPLSAGEMLLRGLTFSNEWGLSGVRLGTNGPFWSLSYEAGYYLLFGVLVFASGLRRAVLALLVCAVIGPQVLLLLATWWFGVWLWRAIAGGQVQRLPVPAAWACALALPVGYVAALGMDLPGALMALTAQIMDPAPVRAALRFSDEVLWNTLLAAMVAAHLAGMARLLSRAGPAPLDAMIRWLAGASFSIYAVHYPLLQFTQALLPTGMIARDLVLLGTVLIGCLVFAWLFERRLETIRAPLAPLFARR